MQEKAVKRLEDKLRRFRAACVRAASAEWVPDGQVYDPEARGPLHGHCGVVAFAVSEHFGGHLVGTQLNLQNGLSEIHIWNAVPLNPEVRVEYDLTGRQYGGDGLHVESLIKGHGQIVHFSDEAKGRGARFYERVLSTLKGGDGEGDGIFGGRLHVVD